MLVAAGLGSNALARVPRSAVGRLRARDVALADLGARFAAADPATARALLREVRERHCLDAREPDGARRLRAVLLGRRTRERDLARGDLLAVNGWLLGRSEVACCVALDALRGGSAGRGGVAAKIG